MNTIQTHFWAVRDYLAPVLRESKFKEHGRITPEEFVAAGDFLAYKFPTWAWSAATSSDPKYTRDFLPDEKQYLVSRGVPCLRRVSQMERAAVGSSSKSSKGAEAATDELILNFGEGHDGEHVQGKGSEEDWLATHVEDERPGGAAPDIADIPDGDITGVTTTPGEEDDLARKVADTSLGTKSTAGTTAARPEVSGEIGDIPDMEDEDDDELGGLGVGVEEADDPAAAQVAPAKPLPSSAAHGLRNSKLLSVRTYDCLITYDKYYQTPRMWLVGYNESGQPLKPAEIFEDVSSDYAQKTVTVEPFPHGNMSTASIHPCKHASVMKKVIERMNASVVAEQRRAIERRQGNSSPLAAGSEGTRKKRGWGLGGAMKKVTGGKDSGADGSDPQGSLDGPSTGAGDDSSASTAEPEGLRVDQYLLIFLKFMASIVPAIEIDATQAM